MLDHSVGIDAESGLALAFFLQVRPDMHACRVPSEEERLVRLLCLFKVVERSFGEFLINRFHPLFVERTGALDLLRAVRVRPGMNDAARLVLLDQCWILEV